MHLWAERFVFQGFLEEGVKTYLMAPIKPLNSATFSVFTSIVYLYKFHTFSEKNIAKVTNADGE